MLRLAVLGSPVAQSRSPVIHQAALDHLGLEGTYQAWETDAAGMVDVAEQIRSGELSGANITMPHKVLAHDLCDRVVGPAAAARSVNTWVGENGLVVGHSTDIPAIKSVWVSRNLPSERVLVLGSGGAAAAALIALESLAITVSARRPEAAQRLVARTGSSATIVEWGTGIEGVVVNATPLGMQGESLPEPVLRSLTGVFEMAYGRSPTPATKWCVDLGLPNADGVDLLVGQAALSFELWTGQKPPLDIMEATARK